MKIETSKPVSQLTQRILIKLAKRSALIFEPDDSPEQQTARQELMNENDHSCLRVIPSEAGYLLYLINTDHIKKFKP